LLGLSLSLTSALHRFRVASAARIALAWPRESCSQATRQVKSGCHEQLLRESFVDVAPGLTIVSVALLAALPPYLLMHSPATVGPQLHRLHPRLLRRTGRDGADRRHLRRARADDTAMLRPASWRPSSPRSAACCERVCASRPTRFARPGLRA
jgi:hypothetical protein